MLAPVSYAATTENGFIRREINPSVSEEEEKLMRNALVLRDLYADDLVIEPLYDANNEPSFLLGVTSLGSAIMDRRSAVICECGEFNPFNDFGLCKKYYGGILSYYVRRVGSNEYTNLTTGQEGPMLSAYMPVSTSIEGRSESMPIKGSDIRLESPGYITRYAFGFNQNGTCNQAGCGIALNYLRLKHKYPLSSPSESPELLTKALYNSIEMIDFYPNAEAMHQAIIGAFNSYGLFGNPLFAWGPGYPRLVNAYIQQMIPQANNRPNLYYVWGPSVDSIQRELLVHIGWYDSFRFRKIKMGNLDVWEQKEYWVNRDYITYAYFFTLP